MLLFWHKGFDATSISDLTEAMGINSPSLYAAFGSKEALYIEALEHYRATYDPPGWERLNAAGPVRDALAGYLAHVASRLAAPDGGPTGCMVSLASVCPEQHPALHARMRAERAVSLDRLTARIAAAVATGELAPGTDAAALARFVQTVLIGLSTMARDGASAAELEAVVEVAMSGWDARVGAVSAAPGEPTADDRARARHSG